MIWTPSKQIVLSPLLGNGLLSTSGGAADTRRSWKTDGVDERINAGVTIDTIAPYNDASIGNDSLYFTAAVEVKMTGAPGQYDTVMGAMNGFTWNQGFGFYWESSTQLRVWIGGYNNKKVDITGLTATNWNHFAFTWEYNPSGLGGGINTRLIAYLNGAAFGSLTGAVNFYGFWGTTNTFRVGADNDSSTYCAAYTRRAGIWSWSGTGATGAAAALSASEISTIYEKNALYTATQPSYLKLCWDGRTTDSTTAAGGILDSSGNAYHGTGSNMEAGDLDTEVRAA